MTSLPFLSTLSTLKTLKVRCSFKGKSFLILEHSSTEIYWYRTNFTKTWQHYCHLQMTLISLLEAFFRHWQHSVTVTPVSVRHKHNSGRGSSDTIGAYYSGSNHQHWWLWLDSGGSVTNVLNMRMPLRAVVTQCVTQPPREKSHFWIWK